MGTGFCGISPYHYPHFNFIFPAAEKYYSGCSCRRSKRLMEEYVHGKHLVEGTDESAAV